MEIHAMGGKKNKAGDGRDRSDPEAAEEASSSTAWFRENIEAIVIAVIMALVIRHFCVEAFKIPTSSMEPTLYGDHPEEGIQGDRILVNKFVYQLRDPARWDVIVFKYPLDRSKNFIKRLVGLPGEEVKIWGGNVYVNETPGEGPEAWSLARKPRVVQEAVWQEMYDSAEGNRPGAWIPDEGSRYALSEGRARLAGLPDEESWIMYRDEINARNSESTPTAEVRLAFDAAVEGAPLMVHLHISSDANLRLVLPVAGGGEAKIFFGDDVVASGPFALAPGRPTRLAFSNVDGEAVFRAEGETVLRYAYDPGPYYSRLIRPRVRVGIGDGGEAVLENITLCRDIHYVEDARGILGTEGTVRIPEDCFFVLGDNCTSSKDSRLWRIIRFTLGDGTVLEGEYDLERGKVFSRDRMSGEIHLTDINGIRWHLTRDEVVDFDARPRFAPFVPRDILIGQAFMVFWPPKRIHLIH